MQGTLQIPLWTIIVTSAAVGALISASITALSAWFERNARRKELLLSKAIELAMQRTDLALKVADRTGRPVTLYDTPNLAEVYHKQLRHLLDRGDLPKDTPNRLLTHLEEEVGAARSANG